MRPTYYVYIMASHTRVIYIGVTNDLQRRVIQHKQKATLSFTARLRGVGT
jgi:putative endonuclease